MTEIVEDPELLPTSAWRPVPAADNRTAILVALHLAVPMPAAVLSIPSYFLRKVNKVLT
jgi:hypothetical protein